MLSMLVVIALMMLAALIVVFLYFDNKNKLKIQQIHQERVEQATNVTSRYKVHVASISEDLSLSPGIRSKLMMIGNNFFVYQAISQSTVDVLVHSLDKVSKLFSALQDDFQELGEESTALDKIESFTEALPQSPRGFNVAFYNGNLSVVCQLLTIATLDSDNEETLSDEIGTYVNEIAR